MAAAQYSVRECVSLAKIVDKSGTARVRALMILSTPSKTQSSMEMCG